MAELVDALDSKSSGGNTVWVRAPPSVLILFYQKLSGAISYFASSSPVGEIYTKENEKFFTRLIV